MVKKHIQHKIYTNKKSEEKIVDGCNKKHIKNIKKNLDIIIFRSV